MFKLRRGRGTRDQIANIHWIIETARELQKSIYFCLIDYAKALTVWIITNWKILKEMGIPDHLTRLLRNLYAGQEATVWTKYRTMDWFQLGNEYVKAVYCHLAYSISMQNASCEMPGWIKHKLESRLQGEISTTSDMQMTPPYGRKWRGTKKRLDESERGVWKSRLKPQRSKN